MHKRRIVSLYWSNISPAIVANQKKIFSKFGFSVEHFNLDGVRHTTFINNQLSQADQQTTILFVDIDCFPLNGKIVESAFEHAESGALFGVAQVSNHLDPRHRFAAPCFLAISKPVWEALGRPGADTNQRSDVAQEFSRAAEMNRVPIVLKEPEFCLIPKYRYLDRYPYGIGTFFAGGVFHLYESRRPIYEPLFHQTIQYVLDNKPIDYLSLAQSARVISVKAYLLELAKKPFRFAKRQWNKLRPVSG